MEASLKLGDGVMIVNTVGRSQRQIALYSEKLACPVCNLSFPRASSRVAFPSIARTALAPRAQDWAPSRSSIPTLIVPNPDVSPNEGAIAYGMSEDHESSSWQILTSVATHYGILMDRPWKELSESQQRIVLYGTGQESVPVSYETNRGLWSGVRRFEGVIPSLQRRYDESTSDYIRGRIEEVMSQTPCKTCGGTRLNNVARAITVADKSIDTLASWPVARLQAWIERLIASADPEPNGDKPLLSAKEYTIAERALKEIRSRLTFLVTSASTT